MRIFIYLWCSLIVAIIVHIIAFNYLQYTGSFDELEINIPGNVSFAVFLGLMLILVGKSELVSFRTLLGIAGFISSCVALGMAAPYVMPNNLFLGLLMTAPFGAIGHFPPGADMDFSYAARAWGLSVLVPIGAGLLLGIVFRKLGRRMHS